MSDVSQLEQQLKDAKYLVERRDMALKLSGNREFRKLILDDYLVTEAARLIGGSGDPNLKPDQRADMVEMAKATGHLKRFLSVIVTMGNTAANDLPNIEEHLSEARTEDETGRTVVLDGGDLIPDTDEGGLA